MKRTLIRGATVSALALVAAFAMADTVQVTVNDRPVRFDAAQPQMMGGRVLVPLRGVFEQMGADVHWMEDTQSVVANGNGRTVRLRIGSMDANVNGRVVSMDVAPQLIDGSTMVPLRFLSQSLGAKVDWRPENNLVAITTRAIDNGAAQQFIPPQVQTPPPIINVPPPTIIIREPERRREEVAPPPPAPEPPLVFSRDTVIPLWMDQQLTSNHNQAGDKFTATVRGDGGRYMDLPDGTIVEGTVRSATPASGSHAGTLDVRFTHIRFPDGNRYRISGVVMPLGDKHIVRTANGRFIATGDQDLNIARDAEIGAGAGLVLGSLRGKAVGGAVVGGAIGAIIGVFDHRLARNVQIDAGTKFGLVLAHDLKIERHDLRGQ